MVGQCQILLPNVTTFVVPWVSFFLSHSHLWCIDTLGRAAKQLLQLRQASLWWPMGSFGGHLRSRFEEGKPWIHTQRSTTIAGSPGSQINPKQLFGICRMTTWQKLFCLSTSRPSQAQPSKVLPRAKPAGQVGALSTSMVKNSFKQGDGLKNESTMNPENLIVERGNLRCGYPTIDMLLPRE